MKYYIGLDIGGTTIKGIILRSEGTIVYENAIVTGSEEGAENMLLNIFKLIDTLFAESSVSPQQVAGIGIGCPGMIDSKSGNVVFAGNLGLKNFPLAAKIAEQFDLPVKITNDANAAALGEAKFGAGKEYSSSIMVTLGTGVGGGIVLDGKLFEGNKSVGAEIGHTVIERNGNKCTCGRRGCFEAYSSASALIKKTREAMSNNPKSKMWRSYDLLAVNGKTCFDYYQTDETAKEVVDWYLSYLATGLTNLANEFRPEVIMLGGGVSEQGETLTKPLQKLVDAEIFGGPDFAPVKIVKATLGSRAGAFGAAALNM